MKVVRILLGVRVAAPTLELLEWVTVRTRTYDDVLEAWRSNCRRTAVWDDAVTDGLVRIDRRAGAGSGVVILTARGAAALEERRPQRFQGHSSAWPSSRLVPQDGQA
jgi:hypothetical protein